MICCILLLVQKLYIPTPISLHTTYSRIRAMHRLTFLCALFSLRFASPCLPFSLMSSSLVSSRCFALASQVISIDLAVLGIWTGAGNACIIWRMFDVTEMLHALMNICFESFTKLCDAAVQRIERWWHFEKASVELNEECGELTWFNICVASI